VEGCLDILINNKISGSASCDRLSQKEIQGAAGAQVPWSILRHGEVAVGARSGWHGRGAARGMRAAAATHQRARLTLLRHHRYTRRPEGPIF